MSRSSLLRRIRRRVNRRFYRFLFGLYRAVFPTPAWTGRVPRESLRRILIVRHDHLGDMIVTTPLIAFLKEAAPEAEIDVLASPINASLIAADRRVARVFTNDHTWPGWLRVLPRLRARRYGTIFSLIYGRGLREGLTASLIARRDTYKVSAWRPKRYAGFFTTIARPPASRPQMADQLLHVGHHALGLRAPEAGAARRYPMCIATDDAAQRWAATFLARHELGRFVAVNLAATDRWREWRPDRCAEFLSLVLERHDDLTLVLTPPPGKQHHAEAAARRCATGRVVVAPPSPRIIELAALLRRAAAVVTPDTGTLHVAAACGRPVVALYTPKSVHLARWLPWGVPHRAVSAGAGQGISDIPPERIATALDELLAEVRNEMPERPAALT